MWSIDLYTYILNASQQGIYTLQKHIYLRLLLYTACYFIGMYDYTQNTEFIIHAGLQSVTSTLDLCIHRDGQVKLDKPFCGQTLTVTLTGLTWQQE